MLRWQLQQVHGRLTVSLSGVLDENADLRPLGDLAAECAEIAFDLSGVKRISSTGVREWIDLMRSLDGRCRVGLVACSPASVTQLNLISNFRGGAHVESFMAPYECPCCGAEREVLFDAAAAARAVGRAARGTLPPGAQLASVPTLPAMPCISCGSPMELAELPERYLTFLADQTRTGRQAAIQGAL